MINKVEAEQAAGDERTTVRVEHVGSLLKPPSLQDAYRGYVAGGVVLDVLRAEQDAAVASVLVEQEARGIPLLTDGELRRAVGAPPGNPGPPESPALDEYRFARSLTARPLKVAVAAPDRLARDFQPSPQFPHLDLGEALARTVAAERSSIGELVGAGCQHIQLDSLSYSPLSSAHEMARLRGFGHDPMALLAWSIWANNEVVADAVGRVTTALHICAGNYRASGHPGSDQQGVKLEDPLAEELFGHLRHDRFLVDCGSQTGYQWLRFVPPDKTVVLGLVSTRPGTFETVDSLTGSVEEASRFLPIEQLAIGPRCGFAVPDGVEAVTADEQWRKLDTLLRAAQRIWGSAI